MGQQGMQYAYATYKKSRTIAKSIVDYLYNNAPNMWKLLKYESNPLSYPNLTDAQKQAMISKESFDNDSYNVLFQKYTQDAKVTAISQIRVFVEDIISKDRTNGFARVVIQIVVNNRNIIVPTEYSNVDRRDLAIMQEIVEALNGVKLNNDFVIFVDGTIDRYAGAKYGSFNSEYSGYELTLGVNIW